MERRSFQQLEDEINANLNNPSAFEELIKEQAVAMEELYWAIRDGDSEKAEYLQSLGFSIYDQLSLESAAEHGDWLVIEYLANKGFGVQGNDDAAICLATETKNLRVISRLLELGANIHARNETPIRHTAERGYIEGTQYLAQRGASIDAALEEAKRWNHHALVEWAESYKKTKALRDKLDGELEKGNSSSTRTKI